MRILTALASVIALGAATLAAQEPAQQPAQPPAQQPAQQPAAGRSPAQLLGLSVYAAKQQSKDQQTKDETECLAWAEQQAGIKMPAAPAADTAAEKKKGLRGRRDAKKEEKAAEQAEAKRQQQLTTLKKPMTSCLQGREYTVN